MSEAKPLPQESVIAAAWEARNAYFSAAPEKSKQERLCKAMWSLANVLHRTASPQEPSRGEIEARVWELAADRAQIEVNACRHHEGASKGADRRLHHAAGNVADEIVRFCRAKAAAARGGK